MFQGLWQIELKKMLSFIMSMYCFCRSLVAVFIDINNWIFSPLAAIFVAHSGR